MNYDSIFERPLNGIGDLANLVYNDVLLLHKSSEINKLKGVDITKKEILKNNISAVHHKMKEHQVFFSSRTEITTFHKKGNKPDFNRPTMLGRISIENFKLLIETIKSSTKN